jgi:sucrose-6-phosphate hydrolase SacC (GH32 family)
MFPFRTLTALALALCAGVVTAQNPAYNQPFRPQVHYSPQRNWTNDPNGLVFFRGEYHLFYQYNPFGDEWGHMSWGHAVSRDLIHWHELPVAIPEQDGISIFTGSVVVDRHNTSGFCTGIADGCLVAIYTAANLKADRQRQDIAFSRDAGRTWTKFSGNPVLDLNMADFRDPSVQWDAERKHWLMAVSLPKQRIVRFYTSSDLKAWTRLSEFGPAGDVDGDWECPDLLQIPSANGGPGTWALKVGLNPGALQGGSGEQYFLGNFDGTRFTTSPGTHGWTNYGKDDYCAISFNDLPPHQKPILIGWMSNWQYAAKLPTSPWRGQMSLPRRLSYVDDSIGPALQQEPVLTAGAFTAIPKAAVPAPFQLKLVFPETQQQSAGVKLYSDETHYTEVGFDPAAKVFYIDRTHSGENIAAEFPARTQAPLASKRPMDLTLIIDRSSVEAFAQNGTIAMTNLIFPVSNTLRIEVFPAAAAKRSSYRKLPSIW